MADEFFYRNDLVIKCPLYYLLQSKSSVWWEPASVEIPKSYFQLNALGADLHWEENYYKHIRNVLMCMYQYIHIYVYA